MSALSLPTDLAASACTAAPSAPRRSLLTGPAVIGIAYTASWIAGLSVWGQNLSVTSTAHQVVTAYSSGQTAATIQFVLTEGLPAIGLAAISAALSRAALRTGLPSRRARFIGLTGALAATISLIQTVLGLLLAQVAAPAGELSRSALLFEAVNRLDGVKMFALAALALGAGALVRTGALPKWLGYTGIALAVTIIASGFGYLLLSPSLALLAYASLPLLLVWITGSGIVLGRTGR